jgi:hypothetical protein
MVVLGRVAIAPKNGGLDPLLSLMTEAVWCFANSLVRKQNRAELSLTERKRWVHVLPQIIILNDVF